MALRTANIIGSGPNGLAAAITLAERGVRVTMYERQAVVGGACTTAELTLPGFQHDLGSSVYPLGVCSPVFKTMPLEQFGLRWIEPDAPLAHPLDDGRALLLEHTVEATAAQFSERDAKAWRSLFGPTVRTFAEVVQGSMQPLLTIPKHPVAMASFGAAALLPAKTLAKTVFSGEDARLLFAGCAAHAVIPLHYAASSGAGLMLAAAAQTTGWPIVAGGAKNLTLALAGYLQSLGGRIVTMAEIRRLDEVPAADVTLFDTSVGSMRRIAGNALTPSFQARLAHFRRGPGIFKLDWALRGPIPWKNAACLRAATVHLGGSVAEICTAEEDAYEGRPNGVPFVLLVQPSLFDSTRAPEGRHTAWAYCHVPKDTNSDWTATIEAQVERFAPGFRETVMARRAWGAASLEAWNPNLVGGDVSGGAMTLGQIMARPTLRLYRTSNDALYLCSSSTPPGGGVHGMCGLGAAMAALADHA